MNCHHTFNTVEITREEYDKLVVFPKRFLSLIPATENLILDLNHLKKEMEGGQIDE